MAKCVLVPLGPGFEEMEAVIIIDVLRRAGIDVLVAGVDGEGPVLGSRGITVVAEANLEDVLGREFDAIVLPGGLGGTEAMRADARLVDAIAAHAAAGRLTAAVCAAPLVLERAGLASGMSLTSHPSVRPELEAGGARISDDRVVRDGTLLTSQGPGTAMEFALAVVADLVGAGAAAEIGAAMCI